MFHMEPRLRFWGSIPSSKTSIGLDSLFSKLSLSCSTLAVWRSWVARMEGTHPFPPKSVEGHRVVSATIKYAFANSNLKKIRKKMQSSVVSTSQFFQFCFLLFLVQFRSVSKKKQLVVVDIPKKKKPTTSFQPCQEWVFCFIDN